MWAPDEGIPTIDLRFLLRLQAEFVANFMGQLGRKLLSWQVPLQTLYLVDIVFCGLVRLLPHSHVRVVFQVVENSDVIFLYYSCGCRPVVRPGERAVACTHFEEPTSACTSSQHS